MQNIKRNKPEITTNLFDNVLYVHYRSVMLIMQEPSSAKGPQREVSFADNSARKRECNHDKRPSRGVTGTSDFQRDYTGFRAEVGTEGSTRESETSSVPTYTNMPVSVGLI